ncbi:MFS transporter [Pelomyxa schiedti]|nr:MFS transporter [Pelomyxa schiedti]
MSAGDNDAAVLGASQGDQDLETCDPAVDLGDVVQAGSTMSDDGPVAAVTKSEQRWFRIAGWSSWTFICSAVMYSLSGIVLPHEAEKVAPSSPSLCVGIVSGIGCLFQVWGLIACFFSDQYRPIFGRRSPYIVLSGLLIVLGSGLMYWGDAIVSLALVVIAYLVLVSGVAVGTSIMHAMIPDQVPQSQYGLSSGIMGLFGVLGTAFGYGIFATGISVPSVNWIYIGTSFLFGVTTIIAAREFIIGRSYHTFIQLEDPSGSGGSKSKDPKAASGGTIRSRFVKFIKKFWFSAREHPDFALVLCMRFFFYFHLATLSYLPFWLSDVIGVADSETTMGIVGLIMLIAALTTSFPSGKLSDTRLGRKVPICVGLVLMSTATAALMFVEKIQPVYVVAAIYGLGNGMYWTLEDAMACDSLPSKQRSGIFMSEYGLVLTVGGLVGQLLNGLILDFFKIGQGSYSDLGYTVLFSTSLCALAASFIFTFFVNLQRARQSQRTRDDESL